MRDAVNAPTGVAVKRDQRRVTVSTLLAIAAVVPLAAVKALTWTATDWPRRRAVVSAPLVKFTVLPTSARPFVSTLKVGPVAKFTVSEEPIPRLAIKEPEAAGIMSVTIILNCDALFCEMETTVPSTVSTTGLARSGSISWTVKVPSEWRMASMLAASPVVVMQADSEVAPLHRVPLGSRSKTVVEAVEAVMGGWFTIGAGAIVTVEPETVAMPVKSSMRSSWPEARLDIVPPRGRAKALTTLVVAELMKLMVSAVPVRETAFARLTSMPSPALAAMASEVVIVDVKGPGNVTRHT